MVDPPLDRDRVWARLCDRAHTDRHAGDADGDREHARMAPALGRAIARMVRAAGQGVIVTAHSVSSPRRRGPIATKVSIVTGPATSPRRGVWVPACAGTTAESHCLHRVTCSVRGRHLSTIVNPINAPKERQIGRTP